MNAPAETGPAETGPANGPALAAMKAGLVLTVSLLVALVIDQAIGHTISDYSRRRFAPFGLDPDSTVLYVYLYAVGAIGVVLWLVSIRAIRRRRRWGPALAGLIWIAAVSVATLNLIMSEYDGLVFPVAWSLVGFLPVLAGLIGVILLWTRRSAAVAS